MPPREHTDPKALEAMWKQGPPVPPTGPDPGRRLNESNPWYLRAARALWRVITVDLWREPIEIPATDAPVLRRIKIHEYATAGAKRLHKLPPDEAAEILGVTAMLLGFEESRVLARRQGVR
jgi:hypothetical protein